MGRTVRWVAAGIAALAVAGTAWGVSKLRQAELLDLQICMESANAFAALVCHAGMYRLHPSAEEIRELNAMAGAQFPVSMEDESKARELLAHLMKAGLDVNAVDQRSTQKWTALHLAAVSNRPQEVRLLLEAGADRRAQDAKGRTPLDLANERLKMAPTPELREAIQLLDAVSN